jgi:predicted AAA+ superfamily ATPase
MYFFDVGIANVLLRRGSVEARSESFGRALEHLVFLELRAFLDYQRLDQPLSFWRTHEGQEVDFVLDSSAIEVKGSGRVTDRDLRSLRALAREVRLSSMTVVCTEPMRRRTDDGIEIVPVEDFHLSLWNGELVK